VLGEGHEKSMTPDDWKRYHAKVGELDGKHHRRTLFRVQRGRCFYCDQKRRRQELTIDHFVLRSKGGGDNLGNKVLACAACNSTKGAAWPTRAQMVDHGILLALLGAGARQAERAPRGVRRRRETHRQRQLVAARGEVTTKALIMLDFDQVDWWCGRSRCRWR
jgi:CRISPR/Cas system Type II protein with McrA/HNH and RuvC-like nuclease domain